MTAEFSTALERAFFKKIYKKAEDERHKEQEEARDARKLKHSSTCVKHGYDHDKTLLEITPNAVEEKGVYSQLIDVLKEKE
jgi:hypothetical protein